MSKAAVIHMTRAMALEWGRYGINVNAICPGYIDTEINHHHWQTEQGKKLIEMHAAQARRQARPTSTRVLMMLCANESHFINGAVIAGRRRLLACSRRATRPTSDAAALAARGARARRAGREVAHGARQLSAVAELR